jgi:hypothetical protein
MPGPSPSARAATRSGKSGIFLARLPVARGKASHRGPGFEIGAGTADRRPHKPQAPVRAGTESSDPSPSSGESGANLDRVALCSASSGLIRLVSTNKVGVAERETAVDAGAPALGTFNWENEIECWDDIEPLEEALIAVELVAPERYQNFIEYGRAAFDPEVSRDPVPIRT